MTIFAEQTHERLKESKESTISLWLQAVKPFRRQYIATLSMGLAAIVPQMSLLLLVTYAVSQLQGRPRLVTWLELLGEHASRWVIPIVRNSPLEKGLPVDYQRWYIAPLLLCVGLLANSLRGLQEYFLEDIGEKIAKSMRDELTSSYLATRYGVAKRTDASLMASFLGDDSREIRQCFTRLCGSIPTEVVNSFVYLVLLILLDTQLFVLFFAIFLPSGLIVRVTGKYLRGLAKTGIRVQTELAQSFLEKIRGWQTIQSFESQATELNKFNEKNSSIFNIWRRSARAKSLSSPSVEWLGIAAGAIVLVLALRRVNEGALPSTILTAFLLTVAQLSGSMQSVINQLNSTKKGSAALRRMHDNMRHFSLNKKEASRNTSLQTKNFKLNIKTQVITPSPSNASANQSVLSVQLVPGDSLAIVGESGSGKSTLMDCIAGIQCQPNHTITLDLDSNVSVDNPQLSEHLRVAYLTQDPFFFAGSVGENVSYPKTFDTSDAQLVKDVERALASACLEKTDPSQSVLTLSGGEKQRLAFARGFFACPDVWLIDEGTSALDGKTELQLLRTLDELTSSAVKIFVAHRPSMQKFASQTIVLSQNS